jgi:hypothetical protein
MLFRVRIDLNIAHALPNASSERKREQIDGGSTRDDTLHSLI